MREIRGELRETRKGIIEALKHFIECDGHGLKLARPVRGRDTLVQVRRPDSLQGKLHFFQRTQTAPGDRDRNQNRGENAASKNEQNQNTKSSLDLLVARAV